MVLDEDRHGVAVTHAAATQDRRDTPRGLDEPAVGDHLARVRHQVGDPVRLLLGVAIGMRHGRVARHDEFSRMDRSPSPATTARLTAPDVAAAVYRRTTKPRCP